MSTYPLVFLMATVTYLLPTIFSSLAYRQFRTPNYRTNGMLPLPNTTNDAWMLTKMSMPPNWSFLSPTMPPIQFDGTFGVEANFTILEPGNYTLQLIIKTSQASSNTIIHWQYNNSFLQAPSNLSQFQIDVSDNWSTGLQSIYIWMEIGFGLRNFTILHNRPVTIDLWHEPSTSLLYIYTDIPLSSIYDAYFAEDTRVKLSYRQNLTNYCLKSNGSATNPADWASYSNITNAATNATNFTALANIYNYSQSNYPNGTISTNLIIKVTNIQIDCTVDVIVTLPDGFVMIDQFMTIFDYKINQTVNFLEVYQTRLLQYTLTYRVQAGCLYTYLKGLVLDAKTDIAGLNFFNLTTIDGQLCKYLNKVQPYPQNNLTAIKCFNNSNSFFLNTSVVILNFTGQYFRNPYTRQLWNFTTIQTARQYAYYYYTTADIIYYELQFIISVIYNITLQSPWDTNVTENNTQIFINGIKLSYKNISIIPNANRFIQAQAVLGVPLTANDAITARFYSQWDRLKSIQGYKNQWIIINHTLSRQPSKYSSSNPPPPLPPPLNKSMPSIYLQAQILMRVTHYMETGWNAFFFGYFVNNFIAFQNLIFLYYFVGFKNVANVYRKQMGQFILLVNKQIDYLHLIGNFFDLDISREMLRKQSDFIQSLPAGSNALTFYEATYSADFSQCTFSTFVLIIFLVIKILLVRLLMAILPCSLIKVLLNRLYSYAFVFILFQLLMSAPQIFVLLGIYLRRDFVLAYGYFMEKINFLLVLTMGFICFSSSVLIFYENIYNKNIEYQRFSTQKAKSSRVRGQYIENSLYIIVPLLVGIGNSTIFIIIMTFLTTFRLALVIKKKKVYRSGQFVKELINKILWCLFNLIYIFYYVTQAFNIDCTQGVLNYVLVICDIAETGIFVGGCLFEMAVNLLEIIITIFIMLKRLLRNQRTIHLQKQRNEQLFTKKTMKVQQFATVKSKHTHQQLNQDEVKKPKQIFNLPIFKGLKIIRSYKSVKKNKQKKLRNSLNQNPKIQKIQNDHEPNYQY